MTVVAIVKSEFYFISAESLASLNNDSAHYDLYTTSISAAICTSVVFTLLIFVVRVYKAYKTTLQRLILYHIIFTLCCELSLLSLIVLDYTENHTVNTVLGQFHVCFVNSWIVYTTVVTNCLLIFTVRLFKSSPRIWRHGKVAECICICLAIIVPMAYVWIPNENNILMMSICENTSYRVPNYITATVINTIDLIMAIEVLFVSIVICCLFCFLRLRFQSRELTRLLKHQICCTIP